MQIIVNGATREVDGPASVSQLLELLGLAPIRVAVELNEDLVPRRDFDYTRLSAGDHLEIVTFVGGG